MEPKDYNTCLFFAKIWLEESIHQSEVLLELFGKFRGAARPTTDEFEESQAYVARRSFVEHYILTSTVMARRFLERLVHHAKQPEKQEVNKYLEATEIAEKIRDMREHSDAYFLGKGQNQQEFQRSSDEMTWDLSCSFVKEDGYYLGNEITIQEIAKQAHKILNNFPAEKKLLRKRSKSAGVPKIKR